MDNSQLKITKALETLIEAFEDDPVYANAWHCSIACCAMDEMVDRTVANNIATKFMKLAFGIKTTASPDELTNNWINTNE